MAERYKSHECSQEEGYSIREFFAKLQKLAETCEFGNYQDEALGDRNGGRLLCGINPNKRKIVGRSRVESKESSRDRRRDEVDR